MCSFTKEATKFLIELYEELPILYDTTLASYKNKSRRREVIAQIAAKVNIHMNISVSPEEVKKKITNLRTQYFHELLKIRKSAQSGIDPSDVYKPTWWCFPYLEFLNTKTSIKKEESHLDISQENNIEGDILYHEIDDLSNSIIINDDSNTTTDITSEPQQKKKKSNNEVAHLILKATNSSIQNCGKEDDYDQFGLLVVAELRKIKNLKNLNRLKKHILNSIYDTLEDELD